MSLPTQVSSEHVGPQGVLVAYSLNVVTPSYVTLTDVKSVTPSGISYDESDDTQLASVAQTHESSAGWGKPTTIEIDAFLVQAQDAVLYGLAVSRLPALWKITYGPLSTQTTGLIVVAKGWVKDYKPSQAQTSSSDKQHTAWTIQVTGILTVTPGA